MSPVARRETNHTLAIDTWIVLYVPYSHGFGGTHDFEREIPLACPTRYTETYEPGYKIFQPW